MTDPFKTATDAELRSFLNRRAIDRMEAAYMEAARAELDRRAEEARKAMDGSSTRSN